MKSEIYYFKELTLNESLGDIWNLLQGTKYYKNALVLIKILQELESLNIKFEVLAGYRGTKHFDKDNKFKSCLISLTNIDDRETVAGYLKKYKLTVKTNSNGLVKIINKN